MTARIRSGFRKVAHVQSRRVLTYVLLLLIGYASSAGTAHRHGGLTTLSPSSVDSRTSSSSAAFDLGGSTGSTEKPSDCQICQFRQSLSNGTIFTAIILQRPTASSAVFSIATLANSSITLTTAHGRAPPVIS